MSLAYRSEYEHLVGAKLAERQAAFDLASPWLPRLASIQRARIARTLSGSVGITGAIAMALAAALGEGREPTLILLASVLGMAAVWVLTHVVLALAGRGRREETYAPPALTGDLRTDLERIDTGDALHHLFTRLGRTEDLNLDLFAIAICLLAPLSLHAVIGFLLMDASMTDYARWIRISLILVGHAHITLAVLAARYVRQLRNPIESGKEPSWGTAFGWTILVTCLPGVILFAVPPLISVFTALAFVPFLFAFLKSRVQGERAIVALAMSDASPVAPARIADAADAFEATALPVDEPETPAQLANGR